MARGVVDGCWERYVEGTERSKKVRRKEKDEDRDEVNMGWWSDEMIKDSHIHSSLARHLVDSGRGHIYCRCYC